MHASRAEETSHRIIQLPTNQVPLVVHLASKVQLTLESIKAREFVAITLHEE
jgi:hypothetical protein